MFFTILSVQHSEILFPFFAAVSTTNKTKLLLLANLILRWHFFLPSHLFLWQLLLTYPNYMEPLKAF